MVILILFNGGMNTDRKPIITIKEARKLLGSAYNGLSDEQIGKMIIAMETLASSILDWKISSTK